MVVRFGKDEGGGKGGEMSREPRNSEARGLKCKQMTA